MRNDSIFFNSSRYPILLHCETATILKDRPTCTEIEYGGNDYLNIRWQFIRPFLPGRSSKVVWVTFSVRTLFYNTNGNFPIPQNRDISRPNTQFTNQYTGTMSLLRKLMLLVRYAPRHTIHATQPRSVSAEL